VVDIGGGTTDFCLIEKTDEGFQRQEVGEHLLLGGDNMDLALAHYIESKLGGEPLDSQEWLKLVAEARKIKEILSQSGQKEARVSFLGKHIIKSARSAVVHEEEFRKILID